MAKIVKYIIAEEETRGNGTPENPYRRITQLFSLDGKLIAFCDDYKKEYFFNPNP